jgi:hypothetical protein
MSFAVFDGIRRWLRAAPLPPSHAVYTEQQMVQAIEAATDAERVACARVCARLWETRESWADECAVAILARGTDAHNTPTAISTRVMESLVSVLVKDIR